MRQAHPLSRLHSPQMVGALHPRPCNMHSNEKLLPTAESKNGHGVRKVAARVGRVKFEFNMSSGCGQKFCWFSTLVCQRARGLQQQHVSYVVWTLDFGCPFHKTQSNLKSFSFPPQRRTLQYFYIERKVESCSIVRESNGGLSRALSWPGTHWGK